MGRRRARVRRRGACKRLYSKQLHERAGVAELADAADSKSAGALLLGGSIPPSSTNSDSTRGGMGAQEIAECTAAELHARLRRKTTPAETADIPDLLILDVRSPESFATGAIQGAPLRRVLDMHAHADHESGGRELARQDGAGYWLHPFDGLAPFESEPAAFDFEPLWEGQRERLDGLEIRVLHTRGHTLGQVSLLVNGAYLLTGDPIFLRSLGRPDLGGRAEAWSRRLYATLQRLAALPEAITVLPGHYADRGEAESVAYIQRGRREIPAPYRVIKRVNLGLESADAARQDERELGPHLCALAHA